jgi:hypothetical protein
MWVILLLLCCFAGPPAFAASRNDIIEAELARVSQEKSLPTIGWNDMTTALDPRQQQELAVERTLNEIEVIQTDITQTTIRTRSQPSDDLGTVEPVAPPEDPELDGNAYNSMFDIPQGRKQRLDPRHVHSLDVGLETYAYHYQENLPITLHGVMTGYYANYAYRPADHNFFNNKIINTYMLQGRLSFGKLDYKGTGVIRDKPNRNFELRGLLGKDYLLGNKSLITPYFGLGFRYMYDEGKDMISTVNAVAYDRSSVYYYLPLGFYMSIPHPKWTTTLNVEYDYLLEGVQTSYLSDVNPYLAPAEFPDVRNHQKTGHGFRGSVRFAYPVKGLSFYLEPFARYWNIDKSVVEEFWVGGSGPNSGRYFGNEPRNYTYEVGSKFGVQF